VALRGGLQNADRKTTGVKMTRRSEGAGELEVYFDPAISVGERQASMKTLWLPGEATDR
jgi:hypothetical protein